MPGEPAFGETQIIGACNAHVGVLEGSVLREFMRVSGCQGFEDGKTVEYCDCIKTIAGEEISSNPEFQQFKERVGRFDRQETAKARFVNKPRTIQLASLANLIAEMDPSIGNPFENGGKCSSQIQGLESRLNENAAVKHNLADLSIFLKSQKNTEILSGRGVTADTTRAFLNSALILSENPNTGETYLQTTEPSNNDFFKLIQESLDVPIGGETSIREMMSGRITGDASSAHISPSDALEAVCANIAESFKRETEVNDIEKVLGKYLDVNGYISQKRLSPLDIAAFRGLKYQYASTENYNSERDDLYFGQMMCESIDRSLFEDATPVEDATITALSNDELKSKIIEGNAFVRNTSKEYEAAVQMTLELTQGLENITTRIESELGVEKQKVLDAISNLSPDTPNYMEAAIGILGEGHPKIPDLMAYLNEYNNKKSRLDEIALKVGNFAVLQYEKQMEVDNMFQELASRFEGSVQRAADFVGIKELQSHSIRYFGQFDYNATGNQGPPIPTHMALNAGEIAGYTGDTLALMESRHQAEAERTATVARHFVENGSKFLDQTPALTSALIAIERGTTSKEVSSPTSRARFTSTTPTSSKGGFKPPPMSVGRPEQLLPTGAGATDKQALTNEEKVAIAHKTMLQNGNGTTGGTDLIQNADAFPNSVITDNTTNFGDFLPNNVTKVETPSATSSLEAGIRSLEERLQAMRERQSSDAEEESSEPDPLDDQIKALTAEIEALRKEKDRINQENEEAREKLRERERISSTLTDQPAGRAPVINDAPLNRNLSRGRSVASVGRAEETAGFTGPTTSGPGVGPVASTGGGAVVDSAPSTYSRRPVIPTETGDGNTSAIRLNREMTLVSGSMGFVELSATEVGNLSVEPISVNFLSLSRVEQAEFMKKFFDGRSSAQAYVKQADGKVVLLNKNESYTGLDTKVAGDDPVITLELNERHLAEQSLNTVYRVQQLDALLSGQTE